MCCAHTDVMLRIYTVLFEQVIVKLMGAREVGVDAVGEHREAVDVRRKVAVARHAPIRSHNIANKKIYIHSRKCVGSSAVTDVEKHTIIYLVQSPTKAHAIVVKYHPYIIYLYLNKY